MRIRALLIYSIGRMSGRTNIVTETAGDCNRLPEDIRFGPAAKRDPGITNSLTRPPIHAIYGSSRHRRAGWGGYAQKQQKSTDRSIFR
jgi:hypothetical protein